MPDYRVEIYTYAQGHELGGIDPFTAELYSETSAASWQECVQLARVLARAYPSFIVAACDAACLELGADGLSDDQREELFRNVQEARSPFSRWEV